MMYCGSTTTDVLKLEKISSKINIQYSIPLFSQIIAILISLHKVLILLVHSIISTFTFNLRVTISDSIGINVIITGAFLARLVVLMDSWTSLRIAMVTIQTNVTKVSLKRKIPNPTTIFII